MDLEAIFSSVKLASAPELNALRQTALSLSALPETELVVFFGSRSRGDFNGSSDIDILVVISDIKAKNRVISILHDIELEYDVPLSPVVFTGKEYEINKKLKSSLLRTWRERGLCFMNLSIKDKIELSRHRASRPGGLILTTVTMWK